MHSAGWGRLIWDRHPSGRGWTIHPLTHLGDVIEFGADTAVTMERWYGYVADADETSIDLVGPFVTAAETESDGSMSLILWRTTGPSKRCLGISPLTGRWL